MATKITAALFLFLCAAARAETLPTATLQETPMIALFYAFDMPPASETVSNMQAELKRILAPSGLRLAWRPISENRGDETYPEVLVLHFRGTCEMAAPALYSELGPDAGSRDLADTIRADGKVLPFGEVECDHLSRYLSPSGNGEKQQTRNGILGRAIARVVAHEIFHMLTGSPDHAKQGIARASHSREDLTARKFDFAKPQVEWLREWGNRSIIAGEGLSPSDVLPSAQPAAAKSR